MLAAHCYLSAPAPRPMARIQVQRWVLFYAPRQRKEWTRYRLRMVALPTGTDQHCLCRLRWLGTS